MSKSNKRNDWAKIIDSLSLLGTPTSIIMGSPGSAQVTRCRLMDEYNGICVTTAGSRLSVWLTA